MSLLLLKDMDGRIVFQVTKYLHGPLSFHITRPSPERPRGRQHQVTSQIFLDANGREHMLMNFYVQGSQPGSMSWSSYDNSNSYYDAATNWISHLPEVTAEEAIQWTKDRSASTWEKFASSFKYLVGAPAPRSSSSPESLSSSSSSLESKTTTTESSTTGKWTGMFSSLMRTRNEQTHTTEAGARNEPSPGAVYTDGEVHAEFVRVRLSFVFYPAFF